jgi:hypothetical protein
MPPEPPYRYRAWDEDSGFFRRGRPGEGRELLTDAELERDRAPAAEPAPADLLGWLHGGARCAHHPDTVSSEE